MQKILLFILILIGFPLVSNAQQSVPDSVFSLIYNQKFDSTETLLHLNKSNINPVYYAVLDIDMNYWKNVSDKEKTDYKSFESLLQKYHPKATETQDQKIIELITLSYQLRYELKRLRLFSAISTRKKALDLFHELSPNAYKLNQNQRELFELYQSLITYFDYYMKPPFSRNKRLSMDEAIQKINQLTQSQQLIVKTLSSYFLGKIYLRFEKTPENGKTYFDWLKNTYPENKRFQELFEECES